MNICIYFRITNKPWGGGNQFLKALGAELMRLGHTITHEPTSKTQIALVNAHNGGPGITLHPNKIAQLRQAGRMTRWATFVPARLWLLRPRNGPVLVHRLDGVPEFIRGHHTKADDVLPAINRLTDHTIFQSVYSKESFAEVGVRPLRSEIIYNGVDSSVFYPPDASHPSDRILRLMAASWSDNPRKGFATLARISQIPDIELNFVGNWSATIDPGNVNILGTKSSPEIAEIMRNMDAMVHAAKNEPCSNAILEALACGLPVLYRDSGGNQELAGDYGAALTDDLNQDVLHFREQLPALREKVRQAHSHFSIKAVAPKYAAAFERALDLQSS